MSKRELKGRRVKATQQRKNLKEFMELGLKTGVKLWCNRSVDGRIRDMGRGEELVAGRRFYSGMNRESL